MASAAADACSAEDARQKGMKFEWQRAHQMEDGVAIGPDVPLPRHLKRGATPAAAAVALHRLRRAGDGRGAVAEE